MLTNQTIEKLLAMKFNGMVDALEKQADTPELGSLSFDDRFGLLVDAEYTNRENTRFGSRIKTANLRLSACFEDIDIDSKRGLDRTVMAALSTCKWIDESINIAIDGKTGTGKTYLACALAHKACRSGYSVMYFRTSRFFEALVVSRLNNRYSQYLEKLAKVDVLVVDDFALAPLTEEQARDLLEVVDDRFGKRPLIIASQLPPDNWYGAIPSATMADAILDRIINGSQKLHLSGPSRRKNKTGIDSADSPMDTDKKKK
jgi:DNA replication protein DnaC